MQTIIITQTIESSKFIWNKVFFFFKNEKSLKEKQTQYCNTKKDDQHREDFFKIENFVKKTSEN